MSPTSNNARHAAHTVVIRGTGTYLPERVLTNHDLEKMVETSDAWIFSRTGIRERRIAREDETTSDMASAAAKQALEETGITPEEIDLIIVATVTPDMPFPSTACFVQREIGATNAFCFDLEAACSGFLYAAKVAKQFLRCGTLRTALVIGAEKLSCVTDWEDRGTCVLFGDGAGAAILQATDEDRRGLMSSVMGSDGNLADLLMIPGGGSKNPPSAKTIDERLHFMKMTGREVFKHAVRCMCDAGLQALERCGIGLEEIDWLIPHQANQRIISAIGNRLGVPAEKIIVNLDRVGNTSSASLPLALDGAVRDGRIKRGDVILLIAFGGGFTWGGTVLEW